VSTVDGTVRLAELMRAGRALLIGKVDIDGKSGIEGWADRVTFVESDDEPMLIRPDGLVAWRGEGPLRNALERWFGDATPSEK
jgi:hypothetical protein